MSPRKWKTRHKLLMLGVVVTVLVIFYQQQMISGMYYWRKGPRDAIRVEQYSMESGFARSQQLRKQARTGNITRGSSCAEPVQDIGFLKVHKAGSTTVMNIFQRFALTNNLTLVLPKRFNRITNFKDILPVPPGKRFNMLINHVLFFDPDAFQNLLSPDAKFIGIVREPLDLAISAFKYYTYKFPQKIYKSIPGKEKLQTYLNNREKYDNPRHSFTNNHIAFYFGLKTNYFRNETAIKAYLQRIDEQFDLVMVMEYFIESVVLLRRLLRWTTRDVIFIKRNTFSKQPPLPFTEQQLAYHRNFSYADYMFYDHFVDRFQQTLAKQPQDFWVEVAVFKKILNMASAHCLNLQNGNITDNAHTVLVVNATAFSEKFQIDKTDCYLLLIKEMDFVDLSRKKQYPNMV